MQTTAQSAGIQERTEQTVSTYCLLLYTPDVERHQEGGVLTVKHQLDVRGVSGVVWGSGQSSLWFSSLTFTRE